MRYKIGVFGSAEGNFENILEIAKELGRELGKQNVIVITGATTGLPYQVSYEAYKNGAGIWGFSAGIDKKQQEKLTHGLDKIKYKKLVFIPQNYEFAINDQVCRKYRNVASTAICDAGIIISGRWGTMNEFTNLHDMGKVIGVLTGTGGIADELFPLMQKIYKKSKAKVVFSSSPKELVKLVIDTVSMGHSGE